MQYYRLLKKPLGQKIAEKGSVNLFIFSNSQKISIKMFIFLHPKALTLEQKVLQGNFSSLCSLCAKVENVVFKKNLSWVCVTLVEVHASQFSASNLRFWVQNSTKTLQNGQMRHPIGGCLKIVVFFKFKKLFNIYNYHMFLHLKFQVNLTYNTKVMSQKQPLKDKGTKNRTSVSCNYPKVNL